VLGNPPRMQYTVRHYFKNFVWYIIYFWLYIVFY
jgi:hypothetical protein